MLGRDGGTGGSVRPDQYRPDSPAGSGSAGPDT